MRKKTVVEPIISEEIEEVKAEEVKKAKVDVPEFYLLRIGETLKDVAKKFNLDVEKLEELNGNVIGTNQIKLK